MSNYTGAAPASPRKTTWRDLGACVGKDPDLFAPDGTTGQWARATAILSHHYPTIPNHGDITAINWDQVEPVDVLTMGFPCQDVSVAGQRAGLLDGNRSGVWRHCARAIEALNPSLVVDENGRLAPLFVEWMQGLGEGHVTGVPGLSRKAMLKALGNGVISLQAAAALPVLAGRAGVAS